MNANLVATKDDRLLLAHDTLGQCNQARQIAQAEADTAFGKLRVPHAAEHRAPCDGGHLVVQGRPADPSASVTEAHELEAVVRPGGAFRRLNPRSANSRYDLT